MNQDEMKAISSYVNRIEELEERKKNLNNDVKDVLFDAKEQGFDPKIIKKVVAARKVDKGKRLAEEELLDLYMAAVEKN